MEGHSWFLDESYVTFRPAPKMHQTFSLISHQQTQSIVKLKIIYIYIIGQYWTCDGLMWTFFCLHSWTRLIAFFGIKEGWKMLEGRKGDGQITKRCKFRRWTDFSCPSCVWGWSNPVHNFPPNDICIDFLQCSWSCGILWHSMGVESAWA